MAYRGETGNIPRNIDTMKPKMRSKTRKPLRDASNAKSGIKPANVAKAVANDDGDDSLDRLLLVQSDLSSILRDGVWKAFKALQFQPSSYLVGAVSAVLCSKSNLDVEEDFARFHASVKRGDIVGIVGFPGKCMRGELGIFPKTCTILSHCLHMLPRPKLDNAKSH